MFCHGTVTERKRGGFINSVRIMVALRASDVVMMIIKQYFVPGIAHSSCLAGGVGACAVIDAGGMFVTTWKPQRRNIVMLREAFRPVRGRGIQGKK